MPTDHIAQISAALSNNGISIFSPTSLDIYSRLSDIEEAFKNVNSVNPLSSQQMNTVNQVLKNNITSLTILSSLYSSTGSSVK